MAFIIFFFFFKKFEKVEKTGIIDTKVSLRCTPSVILGMLCLQLCNSKALHTSHTYIKKHCTHAHCTFYQIGFRTQIATCNPILRRCDFWSKQRSNLYISLNVKPEVQTLNSLWLPTCLLWFTPVHKNLACMSKDYHDMKIDFFFLFSFNFGMRVLLHTRTK